MDKTLILMVGAAATGGLIGGGLITLRAQEAHVNPQVVFKLDHRDTQGRYVMEAQNVRTAYTISPIEGDNPAPLPDNAIALCRPYNDGPRLFLHCGGYRYRVNNIGLIPKE